MRKKPHNLRHQVALFKRRETIVFFSIIAAILIYLSGLILLGDMGLFKYKKLEKTKVALEKEIALLESDNRRIKSEVKALREDPFYIEKYAREEFGLARQGEYIFQFQQSPE